tara:strand:- start:268 stop:648 length:381 start_codon:yes stop_codon:yes gene_type:complete
MPTKEMVMTDYNIEKIENGIATVRYSDNSWAELLLSKDMTEADLDDLAHQFAPKAGVAPSFAKVGFKSTASALPIEVEETPANPAWLDARMNAYGTLASQIEYITENGLDKWQEQVAKIKADNPKS